MSHISFNTDSIANFSNTLATFVRNLSLTARNRKQALSIAIDSVLVVFSLWAALSLRFGVFFVDFESVAHLFIVLPPVTILIFTSLGIYRWIVRSSTSRLYTQLLKGAACSGVILLMLMYLVPPALVNPRSLFIIFTLILMAGTCGIRVAWKRIFDSGNKGMPIAVYGAGSAGEQLVASLASGREYRPVCFIDDAAELSGTTVKGIPVLYSGSTVALAGSLATLEVSQIVIAIPSLSSPAYEQVVARLEQVKIPFKTLPGIAELVSGQAKYNEMRELSIHDILGRNEVVPDPALLGWCIHNKSVLVTGGGGSIGSELCRQIIRLGPKRLTILDNCEVNLYHITEEMNELLARQADQPSIFINPVLCSVTDVARIKQLFSDELFDTVYHAAAYKHVPIVERHPEQGVEVNVFGTLNLLDAAIEQAVSKFILISTDKAVRPTSAMGASKRVAELILQAKARQSHGTVISMVRFGNVLASSGSVVPKFYKQIEAGGPVTITDMNISRYFMTITEASQLVLQASAIAAGGDVFVLDMGEPVLISHLAKTMIRLHCKQIELAGDVSPSIGIEIIGLRPGEKMYEELFIDSHCNETSVAKVMTANEKYLAWEELKPLLAKLRGTLAESRQYVITQQLTDIVFHSAQAHSAAPVTAVADVQSEPRISVIG